MGNNNNHVIKVATYARVSTQEQATEGTSLEVQDSQLKAFCQAQGWIITYNYVDPGFSGKDGERPGLKRLLSDAKFNLFEKVVVCKLDRMARNLRLVLSIESQLREYQVSLTSVKESIDTSTSTGKMVFQMFGMIAEWEREAIIERTKSGRLQRYKEGSWGPGNPPYGYDYNRETRKLMINLNEARIIKRIYEVYSSGKSMTYIANMLNEERISPRGKNGKGWRNSSVRNLIYNPVYKGTQIVNVHQSRKGLPDEILEKAIKIQVPAIVDNALWDIAQDHRKNNKRLHMPKNDQWLLQGIISCGLCGYSYKTEYVHGRRRYGCRGRLKYTHIDGSPRCTSPHVNADCAEGEIWKRIEDIINDPNTLEALLADTVNNLKERETDLNARIKPIDKRLSEISLQKSKLAEEWVLSSIDPHRIQELKKSLDQEESRLKSIRSEIDPAQLEELQHTSAMLNYWNRQLEALKWNTETEDGRMVRVVDKPHQAVLKIVGLDDKELSGILHFPATKREVLDLLQVKVVVFSDRVEVKALFPIEPINYQVLQPATRRKLCPASASMMSVIRGMSPPPPSNRKRRT